MLTSLKVGARCSSMVRVFAHDVMDRRIDPSWWTHWAISLSSQCPTTSLWDDAYKITLAANRKDSPGDGSGFPLSLYEWFFTICLTPYNRK